MSTRYVRVATLILAVLMGVATGCGAPPAPQAPAPAPKPAASEPGKPAASEPAKPAASEPVKGGTLTVSQGASYNCTDTLNQHTSTNTGCRMIAHHVLDGLVVLNTKDASINPVLATSWEISPDGKVYTFKLRQGVKFHDGTPFNAEAVKFNFDYTMRPDVKHGHAYGALMGDRYEKSVVVDDYTVQVYFKGPHPSFLLNLSDGGLGIDSPTAMQKFGDDYGIKALVGTGPFKFKEWIRNERIVLVRADQYDHAPKIYNHTGLPYLDELVYRDVPDLATRAAALEANNLQVANLIESQVGQFRDNKDVTLLITPKPGTVRMYMMNNAKFPTDDLKVRQAVNHALDKKGLLGLPAWSGVGRPALGPLPATMQPKEVTDALKPYDYPYDPEKAKQLLEEAGWKVGAGGIREKNGQPLTLAAIAYAPADGPQLEPVDQMLRKVGAKLDIKSGDFNWHTATRDKGDFNITLSSDSGADGLRLVSWFFESSSSGNDYGFTKADPFIAKAKAALNEKDMWENLKLAQIEILKEAAGAMGWETDYVYGSRKNIRDVRFNEIGWTFYYDAWIGK